LLDHPFIINSQPISIIPELIERKNKYILEHHDIVNNPSREVYKWSWPQNTDDVPESEQSSHIKRHKKRSTRRRKRNGMNGVNFELNSIIYPALRKLIEKTENEEVLKQIADIKKGFDSGELLKPGFCGKFIAKILEGYTEVK